MEQGVRSLTARWRLPAAAVAAVATRPRLWPTVVGQARALAVPRWWSRWPPLPLPAREYLEFRFVTAYGLSQAIPRPQDLVTYLEWCRSARSWSR